MHLLAILTIPLLLAALSLAFRDVRLFGRINAYGHALVLGVAAVFALELSSGPAQAFGGLFYTDALSGLFIVTIALVNFASALHSAGYIARDVQSGTITARKAQLYFVLFNGFISTMFLVTVLNNLGFVWVAIEMTTLVSAFLVGFYNDKKSVEAAWKYLILCSVGISLALLGTILCYYTLSVHAGLRTLNWTDMVAAAPLLDKNVLKVAFLFILVGYGTKAGLAPMHTWLPDAHSQAPAPISALLSGVLLKTSLYAIMRFMVIVNHSMGTPYTGRLLLLFGLLSLGIAAGFILVQKDLKRLLAYSSIEHVGIITVGLGIGGPLGYFGALFHVFNHAVTKSLMFFGAGEIVKKYDTHNMNLIRGAARVLPFVGLLTMVGAFALAGSPPFGVFFSEISILIAGVNGGNYVAVGLFLLFIAVAFGGIIHHFSRISFGKKPEGMAPATAAGGTKTALVLLSVFILFFGFAMPGFFRHIVEAASGVLQ